MAVPQNGKMVEQTRSINEESFIAREILEYLIDHPGAQDTLEGISEWWLLEKKIEQQMAQVQEALNDLTAQALIVRREGKDSRIHYRINRKKIGKIRSLLRKQSK